MFQRISQGKVKKNTIKFIEKDKSSLATLLQNVKDTNAVIAKENKDLKADNELKKCIIDALTDKDEATDEVEVIDAIKKSNVQMDKETSGHLCLTCDKRFRTNRDLENHIEVKHVVQECSLCIKILS